MGGQCGPVIEVVSAPDLPEQPRIELRHARVGKLLGLDLERGEIEEILIRLGLQVEATAQGWEAVPPSWRFDIAIEADLLEEIARIYGYNRLPIKPIHSDLTLKPRPETRLDLGSVRRQLVARGYQEAVTYSFVDPKVQAAVCPGEPTVSLANPISADMSVMRTSLWPGLLQAVQHNLNRQRSRVRLFETGLRFQPAGEGLPAQDAMLAGVITGRRAPESWLEQGESVDFYDIKGDLESILDLGGNGADFRFGRGEHPALHPGQTAEIHRGDERVGYVGALHPQLQKKLDLTQPVYLFEVKLSAITQIRLPEFTELSKYPEVRRDLAILIDREIAANTVLDTVREAAGEHLRNLRLFDIYEGKGIDLKEKSLALGLTYQHSSRTLNEDEVSESVENVVNTLQQQLGATLRG